MTVSADEFLRRFLIHVLPKRLVRIRHFGLFANRRRSDMLSCCRDLLSAHCANEPDTTTHLRCPVCAGPVFIIERLTSSQLYFQSALTIPLIPRGAALTPPEIPIWRNLFVINVCCRCVPARHALVCFTPGDGVPANTTLTITGQDSNAMFNSKQRSPCLSSSPVGCFGGALQPSTDGLKSHSPPASTANASDSLQTPYRNRPGRHDLSHPRLNSPGQSR